MKRFVYLLIIIFCRINTSAQITLLSENFNGAGTPPGWTKYNTSSGGDTSLASWTLEPDGYDYVSFWGDRVFHSNDNTQFYLTNSDAQNGDTTRTILQSPSFSTMGYTSVNLQFYTHFREYQVDTGFVEVSTNGTTWTCVDTLAPPPEPDPGDSIGAANSFARENINLNAYISQSTVSVRFRYYSEFGYYWAIDNVLVRGASFALPASLLTFSGYRQGNNNILKWTTASEQNNKGFQVERSSDGLNYSSIGFVNSLAQYGSSSTELNYSFADNNFSGNKQYYRLRQVDINSIARLSNTILIKENISDVFGIDGIFPNPTNAELNVIVNTQANDKVILQILDMTGKILTQKIYVAGIGSNTISTDVSALRNGIYLIRVISSSGESAKGKFVKQ